MSRQWKYLTLIISALFVFFFCAIAISKTLYNAPTQKVPWDEHTLLSRPLEAYSKEAQGISPALKRRELVLELARSQYYGALFRGDLKRAFGFIHPKLKAIITEGDFQRIIENDFPFVIANDTFGTKFEALISVRLLKSEPVTINGTEAMLWLAGFDLQASRAGEKFVTTKYSLDAWSCESFEAYVVPDGFSKFSATMHSSDAEPE